MYPAKTCAGLANLKTESQVVTGVVVWFWQGDGSILGGSVTIE